MDIIFIFSLLIISLFCRRFLNNNTRKLLILSFFIYLIISYFINIFQVKIFKIYIYQFCNYFELLFILSIYEQIFLILVLILTLYIYIYTFIYLKNEPHFILFLRYFRFFCFSMCILIIRNSLLLLFIRWELVGLSSYFLINFWYTRRTANKAAIKAFALNKIGDISFLFRLRLSFIIFHTLNLDLLKLIRPLIYNDNLILFTIILILLIFAIIAKSAQIGLQAWLPDAMEGPTPVSALLHAATMVTAGLIIIFRLSFLFELRTWSLNCFILIGLLTIVLSILISIEQFDLKKIIAYSTLNQIGFMIFICGFSAYDLRFNHLINHAIFKARLFLIAGYIISRYSHEQDIRIIKNRAKILPISSLFLLIRSFSLLASFFFTGFFSKEVIFNYTFINLYINKSWILSLFLFSIFFGSIIYINQILTIIKNSQVLFYKIIYKKLFHIDLFNFLLLIIIIFRIGFGYFISITNYNLIDSNLFIKTKNIEFVSSYISYIYFFLFRFITFKIQNLFKNKFFDNYFNNYFTNIISFNFLKINYFEIVNKLIIEVPLNTMLKIIHNCGLISNNLNLFIINHFLQTIRIFYISVYLYIFFI